MDTIIFVVTMVGASLGLALIFASTVLSFKFWKPDTNHRCLKKSTKETGKTQKLLDTNRISPLNSKKTINIQTQIQTRSESNTQTLQLNHISNLGDLVNKKVKTCEMVDVGRVVSIDKQSMAILYDAGQKYTISTYYIREYNQESIVIDISVRYLYHYKSEEKLNIMQK